MEKNYGKEGAEIIVDNTQLTVFGGFAPNSESAQILSKAMGSRTVLSGCVSRGKNDPSQSLQMIERALMTPDELKAMPKGQFIVIKTGFYPMKVRLKLFFEWGISFGDPYAVPEQGDRKVEYADKAELLDEIFKRYHVLKPEELSEDNQEEESAEDTPNGGGQHFYESNKPPTATTVRTQRQGG